MGDVSKRKDVHRNIFFWSLILLAASLPLSLYTTSVFQIILILNWLAEGRFREKFSSLAKQKSLILFISVYLVHVAGLVRTTDWSWGLHDLRIKLPLLVLPLVIGTTPPLSKRLLNRVLLGFMLAVTIGSLAGMAVQWGIWENPPADIDGISIFIDRIRFSLMVVVAVFILAHFLFAPDSGFGNPAAITRRVFFFVLPCWLIMFLVHLQSFTGIVIFLITGFVLILIYLGRIRDLLMKWLVVAGMAAGVFLVIGYVAVVINDFYNMEQVQDGKPVKKTVNGNDYTHEPDKGFIENGYYIYRYICEKELKKEWNERSSLDYSGRDARDQELKLTLIRYLTSLGLRKDSAGVSGLSEKDIRLIESGIANPVYAERPGLYSGLYRLIWEIDVFRKGGNPSGHSLTQRIVYMKTAWKIIRRNFWTGVGTGDVRLAFEKQYEQDESRLAPERQLRAHNQYLTFFLTFGVFGFLWIMTAFLYPVFTQNRWKHYFVQVFCIIAFLSMLNEDTLEVHAGVSFFAYFYALFLFGIWDRDQ